MEKFYATPEAEVVMLSEDDVIKTSSGNNEGSGNTGIGDGNIDPDQGFGDAL